MATRYAKGDQAWGICQRCGQRDRLHYLVFDEQYPLLRVHVECWDPKHPQERLLPVLDPAALWRPSPEDYPMEAPVLDANQTSDGAPIIVTWSAASSPVLNINGYRLYRSVNDGAYALVTTLEVVRDDFGAITTETLTYTDSSDYADGDIIAYYVVAYSGLASDGQDVYEARSNIDAVTYGEAVLVAPVLTSAALDGPGGNFVLAWTAATGGVIDSYDIYRSINAGAATLVETVAGDVLSYRDWGAPFASATRNVTVQDDTAGVTSKFGFIDNTSLIYGGFGSIGAIDNAALGTLTIKAVITTGAPGVQVCVSDVSRVPVYAVQEITINGTTKKWSDVVNSSLSLNGLERATQWNMNATLVDGVQYPMTFRYATGPTIFVNADAVSYYVVANSGINTAQSNSVSDTYDGTVAMNVTAIQSVSNGPVDVSWTEPTVYDGVLLGFDIYVSVNGADPSYLDSADVGFSTYQDATTYSDGDTLVYSVHAITNVDDSASDSPEIIYVGATDGIVAETNTTPQGVGFYTSSLFSTDEFASGSVFGDPLPGFTLLSVFDEYSGGIPQSFLLVASNAGVAPAADIFNSVTVNGITFQRVDAATGTGAIPPLNTYAYRYWRWNAVAADLVNGQVYGVVFA